mgnify:FL=1
MLLAKQYAKYFESIRKRAFDGDVKAMYQVGAMSFLSSNRKKEEKAIEWLEKAVEKGHGEAAIFLGHIYFYWYDNRVESLNQAYQRYQKATNLGHKDASPLSEFREFEYSWERIERSKRRDLKFPRYLNAMRDAEQKGEIEAVEQWRKKIIEL